jgi:hypothetical protein
MRWLICLPLLLLGCSEPKPKMLPAPQSYGLGWEPITPLDGGIEEVTPAE